MAESDTSDVVHKCKKMASFAFQKFRSLEKRSSSATRPPPDKPDVGSTSGSGEARRVSDTPSSNSSSSSLQPPPKKAKAATPVSLDKPETMKDIDIAESKQMQSPVQAQTESKVQKNIYNAVKKKSQDHSNNQNLEKMSDLRAKFFEENSKPPVSSPASTSNKPVKAKLKDVEPAKLEKPATFRQKSNSVSEDKNLKNNSNANNNNNNNNILSSKDVYTKGQASDIKSMFEENIAVKKGLKPDPMLPQGPTVKLRRKVNPNLKVPAMFQEQQQQQQQPEMQQLKAKNRESIPIDKKTFNRFLSKFEDDQSREAAKFQLHQLTQKQKAYLAKEALSWTKKQEEKRMLEEQQEELTRLAAEEEARRREAEERLRLQQEAEAELRRLEAEKAAAEAEAAAMAAEKKKKKKKVVKKKQSTTEIPSQLPTITSSTTSIKQKFQETIRATRAPYQPPPPIERPKTRKLIQNPFERPGLPGENQSNPDPVASVKKREFPVVRENRLGDIKKRFSQFMSADNNTAKSANSKAEKDASNEATAIAQAAEEQEKREVNAEMQDLLSEMRNNDSPSANKRTSMLQSSMNALRGSFEKLSNSKERLGDAFNKKMKPAKPSQADMQSYLLSHVLYDAEVQVDNADNADNGAANEAVKKDEDDILALIEDVPDVDMTNDECILRLQRYLDVFEETRTSNPKKKKKKKKAKQQQQEEEPKKQLKIVQVNDLKQQFERRKQSLVEDEVDTIPQPAVKEPILVDQSVKDVKSMFENSNRKPTLSKDKSGQEGKAFKRNSRLINSDLLSKFDSPEMAEQLKKQKEQEREERKRQRLQKLEEEKKRQEEQRLALIKMEEERQEKIRQEKLKREEEERLERERIEEEERRRINFEKMMELEKQKAVERAQLEKEMQEKREKMEPGFKQKKVLGRIQHIFEKKLEEQQDPDKPQKTIGSIKSVAKDIFKQDADGKPNNTKVNQMHDPSLAGTSGVLTTVKNKFEKQQNQEEAIPVSHGVPIKKKEIPAAMTFALNEKQMQKAAEEEAKIKAKQEANSDWSWKKKDPKALFVESLAADNKLSEKKPNSREIKVKRAQERQRELLDDIHSVNKRLAKKNALKEHEEKMEEYSKFMNEIQHYLSEPDQSVEEANFKDDIKTYISIQASNKKSNKKKGKATKIQPIEKEQPKVKTSVSQIKEQLLQNNDTTTTVVDSPEAERAGKSKVNALRSALVASLTGPEDSAPKEDIGIDIKSTVQNMKDMFEKDDSGNIDQQPEQDRVRVRKKIINVPEPAKEEKVFNKSDYEWKYKKKNIHELQNFMEGNKDFMPDKAMKAIQDVGENLKTEAIETPDKTKKDDSDQVAEYDALMEEVEHYLNAPDRSKEEIEFKSELEKYIDLVEQPSRRKDSQSSSLKRKPQKLDLSKYDLARGSDEKTMEDSPTTPAKSGSKESKYIKEMQNRLLSDSTSPAKTKEVAMPTSGTNELKRGYEKLEKRANNQEVTLISAPKIVPQKFFGDYCQDLNSSSFKTLEQLKAEGKETTWKWKQKTIGDLHTYMTGHLNIASKAIVESHKSILRADIELQKEQTTKHRDAKAIEHLALERDREMDSFLESVKVYLSEPTVSDQEKSFKVGIQSYLDLIEDSEQQQEVREESPVKRAVAVTGLVSATKEQFMNITEAASIKVDDIGQPQVSRVRSTFLEAEESKTTTTQINKFQDPTVTSVNSQSIKRQLVNQFFGSGQSQKKEETLYKAPKTKLIQDQTSALTSSEASAAASKKEVKPWSPPKSTSMSQPIPIPTSGSKSKSSTAKKEPEKYVSKYAHITDEKEREAAILAKYGVKPRNITERKSSSSSASSMDDGDDEKAINDYIENELMKTNPLYVVYGDRLKETPKPKSKSNKSATDNSISSLRNILGQIRSAGSQQNLDYSDDDDDEDSLSMSYSPEDKSQIVGSCSNLRSKFESKDQMVASRRSTSRAVERSSSYSSVGTLFQQSIKEQQKQQAVGVGFKKQPQQGSATIGKMATTLQQNQSQTFQSQGFLPGKHSLAKSASFHKFRQSFESGQFDDDDLDDDDFDGPDVIKATSTSQQKTQIESELAEIRSCPRLQKMFSINKPKVGSPNSLARSSSSSAVPDHLQAANEEGVMTVSEARASIKNIFDSSSTKVTYGGGKPLSKLDEERKVKDQQERQEKQQQQKKRVQFSEKTWVLETINKYFDVIDEDEEEEEEYYEEDLDQDDSEEEEEMEESPTTFSTQVSAQRFTYPSAMPSTSSYHKPVQAQPFQPKPPPRQYLLYEQEHPEESEEEEEESEEEEYEVELEVDQDQDEESDESDQDLPYGASALQRSASSSKMRSLFSTVLQKSNSGAEFRLDRFKANLGAHLQRRASVTSQTQIDGDCDSNEESSDDDDDFQDCSETPAETSRYYRVPL